MHACIWNIYIQTYIYIDIQYLHIYIYVICVCIYIHVIYAHYLRNLYVIVQVYACIYRICSMPSTSKDEERTQAFHATCHKTLRHIRPSNSNPSPELPINNPVNWSCSFGSHSRQPSLSWATSSKRKWRMRSCNQSDHYDNVWDCVCVPSTIIIILHFAGHDTATADPPPAEASARWASGSGGGAGAVHTGNSPSGLEFRVNGISGLGYICLKLPNPNFLYRLL